MKPVAALAASCLLCLHAAATELPVREWTSPGLELSAVRNEISLRGHVASSAHLSALNEAALSGRKALSTPDTYRHVVLPDHWLGTSELLVRLLADMHSGHAAMTRDEVVLRGTITGGESGAIESLIRESVPGTTSVAVDVWAAAPRSSACDGLFAALLDGSFRLRAGAVSVSGEHYPRLNRIADALSHCEDIRLRITGHTDSTGDSADKDVISEQRARAYADYLASQGVAEKRLVWEGRGSAEPVANNRSAAGRNRNRRVAIEIYSPP